MSGSAGRGQEPFALWSRKPEWIEPMLPTPTEPRALGPDWAWEPGLRGTRCLVWTGARGIQMRNARGESRAEARPAPRHLPAVAARGAAPRDPVITRPALYPFACPH